MQLLYCSLQFRVIIHHPPFGAAAPTDVVLCSEEKRRRNALELELDGRRRSPSVTLNALFRVTLQPFFWAVGGFGGAPALCNPPPLAEIGSFRVQNNTPAPPAWFCLHLNSGGLKVTGQKPAEVSVCFWEKFDCFLMLTVASE